MQRVKNISFYTLTLLLFIACSNREEVSKTELPRYRSVSGVYPHLAMYNREGECGTGAIVPWEDDLWVITYGPHKPLGSSDKLYQISSDLKQSVREESIGGTPANRMIHRESNQLFIGPYVIDNLGNVRVIPYSLMPGRHTGNARSITDPKSKILYGTMEEGFYEVDVDSLSVKTLYRDGNRAGEGIVKSVSSSGVYANLPGVHGKGLYSGQGVLVFSNNGEGSAEALKRFDIEAGVLAEWNGEEWSVIRRNQFVEVTGPGGIYGNDNPETDPIWATGWDSKSVILGVRDVKRGWSFFRLPKASHSYDGAHGWNTEWPRVRNIGSDGRQDYLMTMHGMFWRLPENFTAVTSGGLRPRSSYLKVIGDFTRWNSNLVFGCDDSAQKEFLNRRKQKGKIEGPGESNSNLWFTSLDRPDNVGPKTASGSVWINESVVAGLYSEPFLFSGWEERSAWIDNEGDRDVTFVLEIDKDGTGEWTKLREIEISAGGCENIIFKASERGEWIRVKPMSTTKVTVSFNYSDVITEIDLESEVEGNLDGEYYNDKLFLGLSTVDDSISTGALLYGLGSNRRALGVSTQLFNGLETDNIGYYELDEKLNLVEKEDPKMDSFIQNSFAIPERVVTIDTLSVLVVDDNGRRWRFPLGDMAYRGLTEDAKLRLCREVATERDLFSCCGTFYELPAENADGFAKIKPITSHSFRIHDYASYRGMLVLSGVKPDVEESEHIVKSKDGRAALWLGVIDDLWEMGKPVGVGAPWANSSVKVGTPSDPYLIGFYDKRSLSINHNSSKEIAITVEVDPIGHGPWMNYMEIVIEPGESFNYIFPDSFEARWIRFRSDTECKVTTLLKYE